MRKSLVYAWLAAGLVALVWMALGVGSTPVLAQAQTTEETPVVETTAPVSDTLPAATEIPTDFPTASLPAATETPTPVPSATFTAIPSPTLTPPVDLDAIKIAEFGKDLNNNGDIDPGEDVTFIIRIENRGGELSGLVIEDRFNWDYFKNPALENRDCFFTGDKIVCKLDHLSPGITEVKYTVTLKDELDFQGKGHKEIKNEASIIIDGRLQAMASTVIQVSAPTPTPLPSITPTPTPIPSPTPPPTPVPAPSGATILGQNSLSTVIVVLMAFTGILVFTYMGGFARFQSLHPTRLDDPAAQESLDKQDLEVIEKRLAMFREGVIIIFIVSTVLLMGISGTLQSDGVISLLSAIVGYVFGRASSRG